MGSIDSICAWSCRCQVQEYKKLFGLFFASDTCCILILPLRLFLLIDSVKVKGCWSGTGAGVAQPRPHFLQSRNIYVSFSSGQASRTPVACQTMVGKAAGCIDIDGVLCPIYSYPSTLLLWPAQLKLTASITVESNPFLNSRWNVSIDAAMVS